MNKLGLKYIVAFGFMSIFTNVFASYPIWHGIIGGSYVFEANNKSFRQGYEINLNRHYSSCLYSKFLNNYGFTMLYGESIKEMGFSYTGKILKNTSRLRHGGWNIIYKINPTVITGNQSNFYVIKPGVGATVFSGARSGIFTIQAFMLYNYSVFLQKEQNIENIGNHSVQLSVFIGITAFNSPIYRFKRKKSKTELEYLNQNIESVCESENGYCL